MCIIMDAKLRSKYWNYIAVIVTILYSKSDAQCQQDANGLYRFGTGCHYMCHCSNDEACDDTTGHCNSGCDFGWRGPACQYRDIAAGVWSQHLDNTSPNRFSDLANDGDPQTCSETALTRRYDYNRPWWRLWFPHNITLTDLRILTNNNKLGYFSGFVVYVEIVPKSDKKVRSYVPPYRQICFQHDGSTITSTEINVQCSEYHEGNSVRIMLTQTQASAQLVLCDVNIIAGRNLAFNKITAQSSFETNNGVVSSPSKAVDGLLTNSDWDDCSVTSEETNPWWIVEIGYIANIKYTNLTELNGDTFSSYRLRAGNDTTTLVDIYDGSGSDPYVTDLFIPILASVVGIYRPSDTATRLIICETELFGDCGIENMCGIDCQMPCHCMVPLTSVNRITGICTSDCLGRWTGHDGKCDKECNTSQWGPDCLHACGHCKDDDVCDVKDGSCPTGCEDGYYGNTCTVECGQCKEPDICNDASGHCPGGCKPGWLYALSNCQIPCSDGNYGDNCQDTCLNCYSGTNGKCSNIDGECKSGCYAGWMGSYCKDQCTNTTWGRNCSYNCGNCSDETCDRFYGQCSGECKPGYRTRWCNTICNDGTYGINCNQTCNPQCQDVCNRFIGTCQHCKPGYKGQMCEEECQEGFWGENCNMSCGACRDNAVCDRVQGTCTDGCKAGFERTQLCKEVCNKGTYGLNCTNYCERNCEDGCDSVDGQCTSCIAGYNGTFCQEECDLGTWGSNCVETCPGCVNDMCGPIDGQCQRDCKPGYKHSSHCHEVCDDGSHGDNCTETCGYCTAGDICQKEDGVCPNTCAPGYTGDLCSSKALTQPSDDPGSPIPAAAGGSVAGIVVIALVIGGIIFYRRRKAKPQTRKNTFDLAAGSEENGLTKSLKKYDETNEKNATDNSAGGNMYMNASSVHTPSSQIVDEEHITVKEPDTEYYNAGAVIKSGGISSHSIPLNELPTYVKVHFSKENSFEKEFQEIPSALQHPTNVANDPGNKGKSRYKDLYAYDHSRVVLKTVKGQQYTDYINACHVNGYHKDKAYIAAQGPVDVIAGDFWRMIWEQSVYTVVMVTNLSEDAKMKCIQYWGEDIDVPVDYGYFKISLTSEDVFADFTIRHIELAPKAKPGNKRNITQFHFTSWPDKDIPSSTSSLNHFLWKVRQNDEEKSHPWLVHCSAGVGRTGTFIALDFLYDQGMSTSEINIYQCVTNLRYQRVNMVQTLVQYQYLHKALLEAHVLPSKPVAIDEFQSSYNYLLGKSDTPRKSRLQVQFEDEGVLVSNGDAMTIDIPGRVKKDEVYAAAKLTENKSKNRYNNLLAANLYRPFLMTHIAGCSNYINAVYIPSYKNSRDYIISQLPLENTAIDCCRLIHEQEIELVVTFDDSGKEKVGQYLPKEGCLSLDPFEMKFLSESHTGDTTCRNYKLTYKDKEHVLKAIVFKQWPAGQMLPSDTHSMLNLVHEVETQKRQSGGSPVLIHCLNGAERCGMLVVLLNIMERCSADGEVSIPQVIRHIRLRRQQIIPNFDQYKFCHDVLLSHVESNTTYANM